ncbi:hypothetical protein VIGAN_01225200 [Vigna angularis var. angularis]|uniref:Uncharacterized protein n=1 Tax=Vigna angularis var. angularis TaxID=157739 RepID=A0A0S3R201_PHAAN|nr:hypothetical protein VIGAN_01225200 [Vigna angularis var. angularis]
MNSFLLKCLEELPESLVNTEKAKFMIMLLFTIIFLIAKFFLHLRFSELLWLVLGRVQHKTTCFCCVLANSHTLYFFLSAGF